MDPLGFNDYPCERNEVECDNLPLAKKETPSSQKALLTVTVIESLFDILLTISKLAKILYW
jgi:hypothetical protein